MAESVTASLVQDKTAVVKEIKPRKRALLPLGKIFSLFSALLVFIGVYKSINLLSLMGYFYYSHSFLMRFLLLGVLEMLRSSAISPISFMPGFLVSTRSKFTMLIIK